MSQALHIPCRVDYRPTNATHFCEYSGRVAYLSATGCTIQATQRPEPGSALELRLYVPGSAWPIRVNPNCGEKMARRSRRRETSNYR